ncbi:g1799 [Coccomyxa viridis]|uniref:G1799 protein n=1 Tax=Coccomyxa viridis TaxID=1274662 RepID=A0ABP1FP96_9CHLO
MGRELPRSASNQQEQQDDRGPMPMAVMEELAHRLVNVDQRGMNDALQVVRDCQEVTLVNVDGEVELDFDLLTNYTLWKLYDLSERFVQTANGVAHGSPPQIPSPVTSSSSRSSSDSQAA